MNRLFQTSFLNPLAKAFALGVLLMAMSAASAAALTEGAVKDLIAAMDRAVQGRNTQAVAKLLSQGFRVNVEISAYGNKQAMNLTKAQYLAMLEDSWSAMSGYSYQRKDLRIHLLPGGTSAQVTATVRETATAQGQSVTMVTAETALVRLIDGRLLVTEVIARTRND